MGASLRFVCSLILFVGLQSFANSQCGEQFKQKDYPDFLVFIAKQIQQNPKFTNLAYESESQYKALQTLTSNILKHPFVKSNWRSYSERPLSKTFEMQSLLMQLKPKLAEIQKINTAKTIEATQAMEKILSSVDPQFTDGIVDRSKIPAQKEKISIMNAQSVANRLRSMSAQERIEKGLPLYIEGIDAKSLANNQTNTANYQDPASPKASTNFTVNTGAANNSNSAAVVSNHASLSGLNLYFRGGRSLPGVVSHPVSANLISHFSNGALLNFKAPNTAYYNAGVFASESVFLNALLQNHLPTFELSDIVDIMIEAGNIVSLNYNRPVNLDLKSFATDLSFLILNTHRMQTFNQSIGFAIRINHNQLASALLAYFIDLQDAIQYPRYTSQRGFGPNAKFVSRPVFDVLIK